jgi:hypothetical protein
VCNKFVDESQHDLCSANIPQNVIEHILQNCRVEDLGIDISIVEAILERLGFFRTLRKLGLKSKGAPLDRVLLALVAGVIERLPTVARIVGEVEASLLGAGELGLEDGDDKYYRDMGRIGRPAGLALIDACVKTARRRFRRSLDRRTTVVDIDGQFVASESARNPLVGKGFNPTNPNERHGVKESVCRFRDGLGVVIFPAKGNKPDQAAVLASLGPVLDSPAYCAERRGGRSIAVVGDRIFYQSPVMNAIRKRGDSFLIAVKMSEVHRSIAVAARPSMEHVATLVEEGLERGVPKRRRYEVRGAVVEYHGMKGYRGGTPLLLHVYHDERRAKKDRERGEARICKLLDKQEDELVAEATYHLKRRYGRRTFDVTLTPKVFCEVVGLEEMSVYDGYFALISDRRWDLLDALEAYRGRDAVETANKTSLSVFHLRPMFLQRPERLEGFDIIVSLAHLVLGVYRHCFHKFGIADVVLAQEIMSHRAVRLSYNGVEATRTCGEDGLRDTINALVAQLKPG